MTADVDDERRYLDPDLSLKSVPLWAAEHLRFPPLQERVFLRDRVRESVSLVRASIVLSWLLYGAYFLYDALGPRALQAPWIYALIYGVGGGSAVLPLLINLLGLDIRGASFRRVGKFAIACNAGAIVTVTVISQMRGIPWPYETLMIHLLYDFFFSGLIFRVAVPLAGWTVLAYLIGSLITGFPADLLFHRLFFIVAVAVLGAIVSFFEERKDRELWLQRKRLYAMATRDSLSGLFNRRSLFERGPQLLAQARRDNRDVGLLVIDFDYFKRVNDQLGHAVGDQYLQQIASVIGASARRPLDIAARTGGEEFVLLLYDCDAAALARRAEDLRERVRGLALPHPRSPTALATISLGGVHLPPDPPHTLQQGMEIADRRLYAAKAQGRDRAILSDPVDPSEDVAGTPRAAS